MRTDQQIEPRQLFADDSDQLTLQSYNSLEDDKDVDVTVSDLTHQIAMESVEEHLKKITQLPSGLKDSVESDRKLESLKVTNML